MNVSSGVKIDCLDGWYEADGGSGWGCVAVVLDPRGKVDAGDHLVEVVANDRTDANRVGKALTARRVEGMIIVGGLYLRSDNAAPVEIFTRSTSNKRETVGKEGNREKKGEEDGGGLS
jgi:hypothetical protein